MKTVVFVGGAMLAIACSDSISPGLASLQLLPAAPIHFPAIGDTLLLTVLATGRDGAAVAPDNITLVSRNPSVVTVNPRGRIESRGDGATVVVARTGDLVDSIAVTVAQARDSLVLGANVTGEIVSLPADSPFPLSCRVFDAAGDLVPLPTSVSSRAGTVTGSTCATLQASSSGHDTLDVAAGGYLVSLPIVVAIRPVVLTDPASPLDVDSIPQGLIPWAPTLVRNSAGEFDLYFAGYRDAAGHLGGRRGNLHRLVSLDGVHFEYDGVVLTRGDFPCSPRGTGIENVAIVPQHDGSGWRMFFAAGSDECDGWQVFSAVSDNEHQWTPEPGVRIPNGSVPRYPSGEGMVVSQLSSGDWSMLIGSYEQIVPSEDRFQITRWSSTDQLSWRYEGPVLTTRQVGPDAARSVYSPSVTDIAPGVMRMFFTGDNLNAAGGGSRIYSAVSTDGIRWEVEGVVLGGEAVDYYYSTAVDDLLVFVRSVAGLHSLGSVRLESR